MAKYNRMGPAIAKRILSEAGALERDFQRLSREQVSRLLIYAEEYACADRQQSSVADTRGRRWHAYLLRRASEAETREVAT